MLTIKGMLEWVDELKVRGAVVSVFEEGSAMTMPAEDGFVLSVLFGKKQFLCFGFQTVSAAQDFCERVLGLLRAS